MYDSNATVRTEETDQICTEILCGKIILYKCTKYKSSLTRKYKLEIIKHELHITFFASANAQNIQGNKTAFFSSFEGVKFTQERRGENNRMEAFELANKIRL